MLQGSRSFFTCDEVEDDIRARAEAGDLHTRTCRCGGSGATHRGTDPPGRRARPSAIFSSRSGAKLAWRPARAVPDDFCWEFCDHDSLQLDFALGAGSYATALLAEFVRYK